MLVFDTVISLSYSQLDSLRNALCLQQPAHGPRVSYAHQPSRRTSSRIRDEPLPLPITDMPIALPPMSPPRGVSSVEGPKDILSPHMSRLLWEMLRTGRIVVVVP